MFQRKIKTPMGALYLVASQGNLSGIFFTSQKLPVAPAKTLDSKLLDRAESQIQEYLKGKRKKFDLPLQLEGTSFQKRVWKQLEKIPFGQTRSYKDIAQALKVGKAYRAVGTANGKNPLCIIIPCHRVINESGAIGGYAGGLKAKKFLLRLENPAYK